MSDEHDVTIESVPSDRSSQRNYEMLGAPALLYRNHDMYTLHDEPSSPCVGQPNGRDVLGDELDRLSCHRRACARWYYPVDFHLIKRSLGELPRGFVKQKRITQGKRKHDDIHVDDDTPLETACLMEKKDVLHTLKDWNYLQRQNWFLQQEARAHMIVSGLDLDDLKVRGQARETLRNYQRYDTNYLPSTYKKRQSDTYFHGLGLFDRMARASHFYHLERINRADPAYLAPFHTASLTEATKPPEKDFARRQRPSDFAPEEPNGPCEFGNCLIVFPCPCDVCKQTAFGTQCLIHPDGPLLDQLRISFVGTPYGTKTHPVRPREREYRDVLNVGDSVREVKKCGENVLIARTRIHCVFVRVVVKPPLKVLEDDACWGCGELYKIACIDLRSCESGQPSYLPIDLTFHPKYGNKFTDPKIAILTDRDGERNYIHHVSGCTDARILIHHISNLQDVSMIEFASHHPMVLFSAARPYVRPALTSAYLSKKPRVGHGLSLYSVDLRSDQGAFQWSPSATEMHDEGIHSINGLETLWNKPNSVLVASISAAKTWEIDTRMPCKLLSKWSLPHFCDDYGATMPDSGFFGSGVLLHQFADGSNAPIVAVRQEPGTFGLHVYQRPKSLPRFQTDTIECSSHPTLYSMIKMDVASSLVFPSADKSRNCFICGLTSFRAKTSNFLSMDDLDEVEVQDAKDSKTHCVITMTNKGDLFTHTLLETTDYRNRGQVQPAAPLGCSAIALRTTCVAAHDPTRKFLRVTLTNEFPVPCSAFTPDCSTEKPLNIPKLGDEAHRNAGTGRNSSSKAGQTSSDDDSEEERIAAPSSTPKVPVNFTHEQCVSVASTSGGTRILEVSAHAAQTAEEELRTTGEEYLVVDQESIFRDGSLNTRSDMTPSVFEAVKGFYDDESDNSTSSSSSEEWM